MKVPLTLIAQLMCQSLGLGTCSGLNTESTTSAPSPCFTRAGSQLMVLLWGAVGSLHGIPDGEVSSPQLLLEGH